MSSTIEKIVKQKYICVYCVGCYILYLTIKLDILSIETIPYCRHVRCIISMWQPVERTTWMYTDAVYRGF